MVRSSVRRGGDRVDPVAVADEGAGLGHDPVALGQALGDLDEAAVADAGL
jgi:hypothetical protein